jgi:Transposase DNA-binding
MIASWAKKECAGVDFGDERLDDRMVVVLSDLGRRPTESIPAACGGKAERKKRASAQRTGSTNALDRPPTCVRPGVGMGYVRPWGETRRCLTCGVLRGRSPGNERETQPVLNPLRKPA